MLVTRKPSIPSLALCHQCQQQQLQRQRQWHGVGIVARVAVMQRELPFRTRCSARCSGPTHYSVHPLPAILSVSFSLLRRVPSERCRAFRSRVNRVAIIAGTLATTVRTITRNRPSPNLRTSSINDDFLELNDNHTITYIYPVVCLFSYDFLNVPLVRFQRNSSLWINGSLPVGTFSIPCHRSK